MRNKTKSQKGSVLFTVLVVSMMMLVLVTASISLVGHTQSETREEYRSKQAYFLASSCLEAFVEKATAYSAEGSATEEEALENINMLQRIAEDGSEVEVQITSKDGTSLDDYYQRGMGSCTIRLEENGSDYNLKAIATAEYLGETETVVAYFTVKPLADQQPMTNALEIIGTDGGGNSSYNNITVYGNTAASSIESHEKNTLYDFATNNVVMSGDVMILGSAYIDTQFQLSSNPYYNPDTAGTEDDNGQTPGASLTVSRSLAFGQNNARINSPLVKTADNDDEATYNYVNVGEVLALGGSSTNIIGSDDSHQVDIYASALIFGTLSSVPDLMDAAKASASDPDYFESKMSGGQGQSLNTYGNIYTYNAGGSLNGDIYFNGINNTVHGDVYCSGDIYFNANGNNITGNIYMLDGGEIKGTNIPAGITDKVIYGDWTNNGGRATRPAINTTAESVQQYVYYPEHMLCTDGVSTISQTYANMYEDDKLTLKSTNKTVTTSYLYTGGTFSGGTVECSGTTINFDRIITESCVLENLGNEKILIDLDNAVENADGSHDIVIVLANGGSVSSDYYIFVRNSTDGEDDDARFCYFVSDSGVGTTNNEYGDDGSSISTYDHSTFKTSTFSFNGTGSGFKIMDLETYCNSSFVDSSNYLNPTDVEIDDAYAMGTGQIIFLLTEGCTLSTSNQCLIQASIYAPKATIAFGNVLSTNISPYTTSLSVGIIGSVICNNWVPSANNVGIVYQEVSPKSMLPTAKGSKAIYSSGFKLVKYSNS